jgi:hypothetical protein
MKTLTIASFILVGVGAHANLVSNGGFELNDYPGTGYKVYNAGDAGINDWTVGATSVDIVGTGYAPNSGSYALDLVGSPGPGSVSQALVTTPSSLYTVSFYARSTGGLNDEINVSLGATTAQFFATSVWQQYSFVATTWSAAETLQIWSNPNNNSTGNTFIDDVSVEAVPEPATMAVLGLGLAAAARKRRK